MGDAKNVPESVSQSSSSSTLGPCCWKVKSSSGTSSSLTIVAVVYVLFVSGEELFERRRGDGGVWCLLDW